MQNYWFLYGYFYIYAYIVYFILMFRSVKQIGKVYLTYLLNGVK